MTDGMIATRAWLERRRAARSDAFYTNEAEIIKMRDKGMKMEEIVSALAATGRMTEDYARFLVKKYADKKGIAWDSARSDGWDEMKRVQEAGEAAGYLDAIDGTRTHNPYRGKPDERNWEVGYSEGKKKGESEKRYWDKQEAKAKAKSGRGDAINEFRPGDMVRLTNPNATPTYRILGVTATHYQVDRPDEKTWNGGKPALIDKKRIHKINGRSDAARSDTTPAEVNNALKRAGINGVIKRGSDRGEVYYYFSGQDVMSVPSLYEDNLRDFSVDFVLDHVRKHKR